MLKSVLKKLKFFLTFQPDNREDRFCTTVRTLVMTVPFIITLVLTAMINRYVHYMDQYNVKTLLAFIMVGLFINSFLLFMSIICHYRHIEKIHKKYKEK